MKSETLVVATELPLLVEGWGSEDWGSGVWGSECGGSGVLRLKNVSRFDCLHR